MNQLNTLFTVTILAASLSALVGCGGDGTPKNLQSSGVTPTVNAGPVSNNDTPNPTNSPSASESTVTLTGVAATGAALSGNVVAINAKGEKSFPSVVGADGKYTLTIKKAPPYFIKATSNNLQDTSGNPLTLYSYAADNEVANVTELTTYALQGMSNGGNLADIFNRWSNYSHNFKAMQVSEFAKSTLADFSEEIKQAGLTNVVNIFTTSFATNGTGIDKVLDLINLSTSCNANNVCQITGKTDGKVLTGGLYSNEALQAKLNGVFTNLQDLSALTLTTQKVTVKVVPKIDGVVQQPYVNTYKSLTKPSSEAEFCQFHSSIFTGMHSFVFQIQDCSYDNGTGEGKFTLKRSDNKTLMDYVVHFEDMTASNNANNANNANNNNAAGDYSAEVTGIKQVGNAIAGLSQIKTYQNISLPTNEADFCNNQNTGKLAFITLDSSAVSTISNCTYNASGYGSFIVNNSNKRYRYSVSYQNNKPLSGNASVEVVDKVINNNVVQQSNTRTFTNLRMPASESEFCLSSFHGGFESSDMTASSSMSVLKSCSYANGVGRLIYEWSGKTVNYTVTYTSSQSN